MNEHQLEVAEEALRESEERFRGTFENAAVGIVHLDRSGRFLRVNEKYCTIVGYSREELLQMNLREIIHPDHLPAFVELYESCFARNELPPSGMERRYLRKDGSSVWVEVVVSFQRDVSGLPAYAIGVILDISERKRVEDELRQANARLNLAVHGSNLSIWECSMPDGNIQNCHPTLTNVWEPLGYDAGTAPTDFPSLFPILFHPDDQARVASELQKLFAGNGQDYESKYRVRPKDGSTRWHLARGKVVRDPEGKAVRFIGTSTDITDIKQAEAALRASEQRFRVFVDQAADAFFLVDDQGRILDANQCACEGLGYTRGELIGMSPSEFIRPHVPPALFADRIRRLVAGEMLVVENDHLRKDGTPFPVEVRVKAFWEGDRPFFVTMARDISDRKRAEEALRASERRFRVFVDHAADGFFLSDEQGRILDANQRACETHGYPRDELIGMTPFDFDSKLTPAAFDSLARRLRAGETLAFEVDHRRRDGTVFPLEVRAKAFWEGAQVLHVSLARDISERKRLEEQVRLATARLDLALRGSNIGIWDSDMPDGDFANSHVSYVNVLEQLGYERPGSPRDRKSGTGVMHPDDRAAYDEAVRKYLSGETGEFEVESRVRHKDGSIRWMMSRGVAVRDAGGKPIRFLGTAVDVTDRKRAEQALRESEERFRQLAENVDGVFWLEEGGWQRLLYISPAYATVWGRTTQSLYEQPRSWIDTVHPDDRNLVLGSLERQNRGEPTATDFRIARPDGSIRWVHCSAFPMRNQTGEVYRAVGLVEDITERRQLEEELRRAKEAAEAANRAKDDFLANVSHEIRTPMNAIIGMTELVLDTPLDEHQRQGLKTVKLAADSLLGIINDLLDFSKIEAGKLALVPTDFSLRGAVGDTLRALAVRAHKKGLELIYQVQPDVPDALVGDAGRLRQVLLNLAGNAVKFTDQGEVLVRVETEGGGPAPAPGELGLRFTVLDTGIGIPHDQQARIFRAFEQEDTSTTRKYGGTGLGLTIASQLIALMGGTISVDSAPGRGSTFAFTARFAQQPHPADVVPAPSPVSLHNLYRVMSRAQGSASLPARPAPAQQAPLSLATTTPLRILVAEDNELSALVLEQTLAGRGHHVRVVSDGREVLALAEQGGFDLVLLDVHMPGLDGFQVVKAVRERELITGGHLPIIALTARSRKEDRERCLAAGMDDFQTKPIGPAELLAAIDRVLQTHSSCPSE